jgi:hypothetical protein
MRMRHRPMPKQRRTVLTAPGQGPCIASQPTAFQRMQVHFFAPQCIVPFGTKTGNTRF